MILYFSGITTDFTAAEDVIKDPSGEYCAAVMVTFYSIKDKKADGYRRFKKHRKAWRQHNEQEKGKKK